MHIMVEILYERLDNDTSFSPLDKVTRKDAVFRCWQKYGKKILKLEKKFFKKEHLFRYVRVLRLYGYLRFAYEEGIVYSRKNRKPLDGDMLYNHYKFAMGLWHEAIERCKAKKAI